MGTVVEYITHEKCTGCAGCVNSCPVDAIEMQELTDGFIYPVIDSKKCIECGKCLAKCPVAECERENWKKPQVYAAYADIDVQRSSSSGGIFTLLSEYILSLNGKIAGVVYDQNMHAKHILAGTKEEYERMRGSKYVQSNPGLIYREVESALKHKEYVLFTGCPCQVAALRKYLGKEYSNLLCVDILCHGVPSDKIFQQYLDSIKQDNHITNVEFKNKRFGWTSNNILVTFENGKEYEGSIETDWYVKGFLKNLFLRKSCENCTFSEFPRLGDISIGDFWGIRNIAAEMYSELGTSILFINNEKGKRYFNKIKDHLQKQKELEFEPEKYPNRIHALYRHNIKREQFFSKMNYSGFVESMKYCLPESGNVKQRVFKVGESQQKYELKNHDIGLVSNYYAGNFGGSLTQFALYNVLNEMGYSVYMIEHPEDAITKTSIDTMKKIYIEIPYPEQDRAPMFKNKLEMRKLNDVCESFVVGSDQLFQYTLYELMGRYVTLDWVDDNKRKIAYAASFGHKNIWGEKKELGKMAHFMQLFDGFSVREDSAVEICQEQFGVKAEWVVDPVFLCDKQHYIELADKAEIKCEEKLLGSYLLDPSSEKKQMIEKLMNEFNLRCDIFSEFNSSVKYMKPLGELNWHNYKVEERLKVIINCDLFITDSFHGTCLCIIMRKPFISILNKKRGADRFVSLLGHLGLSNRLIETFEDLNKVEDIMHIDYQPVYSILEKDIVRSRTWLKNKLQIRKNKARDIYGILCDKLSERDKKIEYMSGLIECLSTELGYGIEKVTDIKKYLQILRRNVYKYIILIAVKDTSGFLLNDEISDAIKQLGFATDLKNKHWHSYVGAVDDKTILCEALSGLNEPAYAEFEKDGLKIRMESRCLKAGNEALICIQEKNYSVNHRGLNFVIWDKEIDAVIDKVCFDTHAKGIPCYR